MIGTLRNVSLSLPSPSLVAAAAVQIPGRAPVDYFEPVVGGGVGDPSELWPPSMEKGEKEEQSGEEFENGRRRRQTAAQCTRKKSFPVQIVFLFLLGHFTFPQTEKRVRQRQRRSNEKRYR